MSADKTEETPCILDAVVLDVVAPLAFGLILIVLRMRLGLRGYLSLKSALYLAIVLPSVAPNILAGALTLDPVLLDAKCVMTSRCAPAFITLAVCAMMQQAILTSRQRDSVPPMWAGTEQPQPHGRLAHILGPIGGISPSDVDQQLNSLTMEVLHLMMPTLLTALLEPIANQEIGFDAWTAILGVTIAVGIGIDVMERWNKPVSALHIVDTNEFLTPNLVWEFPWHALLGISAVYLRNEERASVVAVLVCVLVIIRVVVLIYRDGLTELLDTYVADALLTMVCVTLATTGINWTTAIFCTAAVLITGAHVLLRKTLRAPLLAAARSLDGMAHASRSLSQQQSHQLVGKRGDVAGGHQPPTQRTVASASLASSILQVSVEPRTLLSAFDALDAQTAQALLRGNQELARHIDESLQSNACVLPFVGEENRLLLKPGDQSVNSSAMDEAMWIADSYYTLALALRDPPADAVSHLSSRSVEASEAQLLRARVAQARGNGGALQFDENGNAATVIDALAARRLQLSYTDMNYHQWSILRQLLPEHEPQVPSDIGRGAVETMASTPAEEENDQQPGSAALQG